LVYELRNSEFCPDFFVKVKNSNFQKTDFSKIKMFKKFKCSKNSNLQKIQIFIKTFNYSRISNKSTAQWGIVACSSA